MADYSANTEANTSTNRGYCMQDARRQIPVPAQPNLKWPGGLELPKMPQASAVFSQDSTRHRVQKIIDAEMEGRCRITHRHPPFVDPLPELADVIVVIQ